MAACVVNAIQNILYFIEGIQHQRGTFYARVALRKLLFPDNRPNELTEESTPLQSLVCH